MFYCQRGPVPFWPRSRPPCIILSYIHHLSFPLFIHNLWVSESSVHRSAAGAWKWLPGKVQNRVIFRGWEHFRHRTPVEDMRDGESLRLVPSSNLTKLQTLLQVMALCRAPPPSHSIIRCGNQMWHPLYLIHPHPSSFVTFFFCQYLGFNVCPETHALRHSTSQKQYACVTQGLQHLPDQDF